MRKVKVGAIQPGSIDVPEACNWRANNYHANTDIILREYIMKALDNTCALIEKAGIAGCDIVTSCEDSCGVGFYMADIGENNIFSELVSKSSVMFENRMSELAEKYHMYIVGCYYRQIDGNNCNVASIFDRKGHIIGHYQKTHLPPDETWQSVAGNDISVFDLDFGKIGISICYDMMFPEQVRVLALKGAEVIFHPTFGYGWYDGIGQATLKTRANDNSVYIVTAKNAVFNGAGKSSVIDFWGHTFVEAGFDNDVIVVAEIDLDHKKTQPIWYNPTQMSRISDVGERMAGERRYELYKALCEPVPNKFQPLSPEEKMAVREKILNGTCRWS